MPYKNPCDDSSWPHKSESTEMVVEAFSKYLIIVGNFTVIQGFSLGDLQV